MSAVRRLAFLCLLALAACGTSEDDVGDLAGTYMLDRDVLAKDFLEDDLRRLDSRERATLLADDRRTRITEARSAAAESDMRMDLTADGGFVVRYRFGAEEGSRGGTWSVKGRQITLRTTKTAEGPLSRPTVVVGQCVQGVLRFDANEDVPHPFTLRRR